MPTAAEVGLKDFNIVSFIGLCGPPNLPADVVKKTNAALNAALKGPIVTKNILDRGDEPGGGDPDRGHTVLGLKLLVADSVSYGTPYLKGCCTLDGRPA